MIYRSHRQATHCRQEPSWTGRWCTPFGCRWFRLCSCADHLDGLTACGSLTDAEHPLGTVGAVTTDPAVTKVIGHGCPKCHGDVRRRGAQRGPRRHQSRIQLQKLRVLADAITMDDVQIEYHEDAKYVVLIATIGDFWLWFTTAPGQLVPEFATGNQIGDAILERFSDAEATAYLETRMQAAGYRLRQSAIRSRDIAVWEIISS